MIDDLKRKLIPPLAGLALLACDEANGPVIDTDIVQSGDSTLLVRDIPERKIEYFLTGDTVRFQYFPTGDSVQVKIGGRQQYAHIVIYWRMLEQ